jgi:4-carboxymuconolactone decarboxylase
MSEDGTARSPVIAPDDLDPDQRAFYDRLLCGAQARAGDVPLIDAGTGTLLGPFAVMAMAPEVGEAVQHLGSPLRYESRLEPLVREAATLMVAVHERCAFEWFAREEPARRAGLQAVQIQQIRDGELPTGLSGPHERALAAVDMMLRTRSPDDTVYQDSCQVLSQGGLAELMWLTGYYVMIALALAVFDPVHPAASSSARRDERSP